MYLIVKMIRKIKFIETKEGGPLLGLEKWAERVDVGKSNG